MYGSTFGHLTKWAIVFLVIFVLFILLVPEREERMECRTVPVY